MWKRPADPKPPVLVVIGAHRNELAFGECVSEELDPKCFSILRIPQGISGERPRPDQLADFRERHRALYLQILQHVQPGQRLLIDLHHGVDTGALSADVLCADQSLLGCVSARHHASEDDGQGTIRCVRLVPDTAPAALVTEYPSSLLVARPEIPEAVWNSSDVLYVGIEIYLSGDGAGTEEEHQFARTLLAQIADCAFS